MRWLLPLLALLLLAPAVDAAAAESVSGKADVTLEGDVRFTDLHHYIEAPFTVPAGTGRLTVVFSHDGAAKKTHDRSRPARSRALSGLERREQDELRPVGDGRHPVLPARPLAAWTVGVDPGRSQHPRRRRHPLPSADLFQPTRNGARRLPLQRRAAASRPRLVSRRPAHAHRPQRRLLASAARAPTFPVPSSARSRRPKRANSTSSPSATTTRSVRTRLCASFSPTSTAPS